MTDSTISPLTASDGQNLAVVNWPLEEGVKPRAIVIIVHGLGEHVWRYDHVARRLKSWGFAVRGYDQYGHGDSAGTRGVLPTPTRLIDDLADMIEDTRIHAHADGHADVPIVLLGHSMGGLVAARFVSLDRMPVDALVLSSPALDPGLSAFQKLLVGILPRIAPNLCVGNGLNPHMISHDPKVVRAYMKDPLVHDRISARLAQFIAYGGPATIASAPRWKVPTLLMYAGRDKLVNPQGSRDFAAAAPEGLVTARCFDELYHEIFNEPQPDSEPVFETLKTWLDSRFAVT